MKKILTFLLLSLSLMGAERQDNNDRLLGVYFAPTAIDEYKKTGTTSEIESLKDYIDKTRNPEDTIMLKVKLANEYMVVEDFKKALENAKQALKVAETAENSEELTSFSNAILVEIHTALKSYKRAIEHAQALIPYVNKTFGENSFQLDMVNLKIANLYWSMKNHTKAEEYFKTIIQTSKEDGVAFMALTELLPLYEESKEQEKALEVCDKIISIYENDVENTGKLTRDTFHKDLSTLKTKRKELAEKLGEERFGSPEERAKYWKEWENRLANLPKTEK